MSALRKSWQDFRRCVVETVCICVATVLSRAGGEALSQFQAPHSWHCHTVARGEGEASVKRTPGDTCGEAIDRSNETHLFVLRYQFPLWNDRYLRWLSRGLGWREVTGWRQPCACVSLHTLYQDAQPQRGSRWSRHWVSASPLSGLPFIHTH